MEGLPGKLPFLLQELFYSTWSQKRKQSRIKLLPFLLQELFYSTWLIQGVIWSSFSFHSFYRNYSILPRLFTSDWNLRSKTSIPFTGIILFYDCKTRPRCKNIMLPFLLQELFYSTWLEISPEDTRCNTSIPFTGIILFYLCLKFILSLSFKSFHSFYRNYSILHL